MRIKIFLHSIFLSSLLLYLISASEASLNSSSFFQAINLNQLESSTNPNQSFTYDDDGNMTQGYTLEGYVLTMAYDAENRLTSSEFTDSGSVVHRTEYFYGGDSVLAQTKKFENGVLVGDARYIRNGFLPVQERDGNNNVSREYMWGLNMGGGIGGLLNLKQSGNDYSYLYDGKGNVSALIDSNQQVAASYRYDVFGKLLKKTGTLSQPFMFSTKQYDEPLGHYNFGYRYYSPSVGRWMTRDPLGEAGGINLYGFVGNSPLNFIDPDGLLPLDTIWDAGNIIYDIITRDWKSLSLDTGALFIPYVPAGVTKIGKVCKYTHDQEALIKLAKEAKRKGLSKEEAKIMKEWAKEHHIPYRPLNKPYESHTNRPYGKDPHIHIGPVNHIPVRAP